ncbi:serine/threonine-protein kinase [Mycobacterium sp. 1274761.0]|uniref:serine/threonine-protein kinase n=1 Tax=Mycobacterium sp. 1274761.0 TaxID=1834077 RepID=UPI0007FD59FA|nr:serine/threonine-protein kinase [Mycobacterium sp. 1274761.0]OBK80080.1 protein kinase [Mycobacterium sp. 1274761.0]
MLSVGDDFAGYVIDAALGRGGYADVYRAHRPADPGRPVALKVLDEDHRGEEQTARLQREFEFAHQLDHPHVITVYDNGVGWLTMEVIDGGTSTALPDTQTRLTALAQIADALDYTHHRGIVHCDVKPSNILVSQDFSRAVLIDFGVAFAVAETAAWASTTQIEASLPYTAPELLRGRAPSALTDQYALACTAVELLLGAPPYAGTATWMELVDAHINRPVPSYSHKIAWVPRLFDSWLHRALAKIPEGRYDSCTELIEQLRRSLGD